MDTGQRSERDKLDRVGQSLGQSSRGEVGGQGTTIVGSPVHLPPPHVRPTGTRSRKLSSSLPPPSKIRQVLDLTDGPDFAPRKPARPPLTPYVDQLKAARQRELARCEIGKGDS